MTWLLLGGAVLLAVLGLARLFVATPPRRLLRGLRVLAALLGVLLAGGLLLIGRFGLAFALAVLVLLPLWRNWHRLGGAAPSAGNRSAIETAWLAMELDHDSGALRGEVRRGPFAGRDLAALGPADLAALLADLDREDAEGARLLRAWIERLGGAGEAPPAESAGGAMSRAEALAVLGLADGASPEAIRDAHRRLMKLVHPDHGGSSWLAARLNQAKDLLLGET